MTPTRLSLDLHCADVVVLTDDDFEDKVVNSDETWAVNFFAPVSKQ